MQNTNYEKSLYRLQSVFSFTLNLIFFLIIYFKSKEIEKGRESSPWFTSLVHFPQTPAEAGAGAGGILEYS